MGEQTSLAPVQHARVVKRTTVVLGFTALGITAIAVGITAGAGLVAVVLAPTAISIVVGTIRQKRQARRFIEDVNETIALAARGDYAAVRQIFEYWIANARSPRVAALSRYCLADTLLHQGDLEGSCRLHVENYDDNRSTLQRSPVARTVLLDTAFAWGLRGNLAEVERWYVESERMTKELQDVTAPANAIAVKALIDCRSGRSDAAVALLDDNWADCEARLRGDSLRRLRILRGFARSTLGPREAGRAHEDIVASRPRFPGEHAYLGKEWPEMAAFLAAHELDR